MLESQMKPDVTAPASTRREDRQAALFDAAMGLFEARGFDAVSVEEICAHAGVGRATFFRLFGGKTGLIEEANRRTAQSVRDGVAAENARGCEALRLMGSTISAAWLAAGSPVYAMFEGFVGRPHAITGLGEPLIDAAQEGSRALAELAIGYIRQGQADGEIASHLDPEAMGLGFMSLMITACSVWIDRDARSPEAYAARVEQAVEVMLKGMAS